MSHQVHFGLNLLSIMDIDLKEGKDCASGGGRAGELAVYENREFTCMRRS